MKRFLSCVICIIVFSTTAAVSATASTTFKSVDYQALHMPNTHFCDTDTCIKGFLLYSIIEKHNYIDLTEFALDEDEIKRYMDAVIKDNPIETAIISSYTITKDNNSVLVELKYNENSITLFSSVQQSEAAKERQRILSCVDDNMSDMEKALAVHDYMCLNYEYDFTYSIYSASGLFENKKGVCQAYTLAYMEILEELGVPCSYVSSYRMNHAWNLVKIDGEWYHVDVTWDDPTPNKPGKAKHQFFLLSDDAVSNAENEHFGWSASYSCTSTRFDDYFWQDVETNIIIKDGYYYYVNKNDGNVYKKDTASNNVKSIYEINSKWWCWDKPGYFWSGTYSGLAYKDERLYINTASQILSIDLEGGNATEIAIQDTTEGYIWGLKINDNYLTYFLSRDIWNYGLDAYKTFIFYHIPQNNLFNGYTGNIWAALYDDNGNLKCGKKFPLNSSDIAFDEGITGCTMKIMYWDSHLKPICNAEIVSLTD